MSARGPARVLMLLENECFPGDVRVLHEARALVAAGHAVTVVCPRGRGEAPRATVEGIRVHRHRPLPAGSGGVAYVREYVAALALALGASLRLLRSPGFDVVHVHAPPDVYGLLGLLYRLLGKRVVHDLHDLSPELYRARFGDGARASVDRVLLALERLAVRGAHHVITTNASQRAVVRWRDGVPAARITVVRNGPDLDLLRCAAAMPIAEPWEGPVLGYCGVLGRQDGVEHLVRAVARLVLDLGREDVRCVVMGDGDALDDLRAAAVALGVEGHVRFTGWLDREEVYRRLAACDVCVVPDPSNPYNDSCTMIKVMEYLGLGRPVAAFDLPEHRVTAQDAALYAAANDDLELARAIATLLDDPARAAAMGEAGRRRIESALAWDHAAPRLLAAYRQLLGGARVGTREDEQAPHPVGSGTA